ncbi:MAG: AIR synthase-related protein [Bdellovibrionales bacterium]|nr:AIR synthase-related protein [Bdellovibrionales bacterium]
MSEQEGISLVGGDLSSSDRDIFINVTLSGLVEKTKIKTRADFSKGQLLCVTGPLGDSGAGLKSLLTGKVEPALRDKHIRPKAYHQEGQWLAQQEGVFGMMDLSDGLLSDLQRLSGGFEIDLESLPLSENLKEACTRNNWSAEELALSSGEDYVLFFSCLESEYESLKQQYHKHFSSEIYKIGRTSSHHGVRFFRLGEPVEISYKAFSHF